MECAFVSLPQRASRAESPSKQLSIALRVYEMTDNVTNIYSIRDTIFLMNPLKFLLKGFMFAGSSLASVLAFTTNDICDISLVVADFMSVESALGQVAPINLFLPQKCAVFLF